MMKREVKMQQSSNLISLDVQRDFVVWPLFIADCKGVNLVKLDLVNSIFTLTPKLHPFTSWLQLKDVNKNLICH